MRPLRQLGFYLEYLVFRGIAFLISSLDVFMAMRLAESIGSFLFVCLKKRQAIALENLRLAYGHEKSEEEIRKIAKSSMQNLVKVAFEFIRIPRIIKNRDRVEWKVIGGDNIRNALKGGKGVIVTVSHFGNWELMGLAAANEGFPLHAIARPIKNPYVYSYIKRLRMIAGFYSIEKSGAARTTIKLLKENKMIAMLIDQHERQGAVWVDFFGRKASTTSLPAILALKYDVPIIATFHDRQRPDYFTLSFEEPFPLIRTGNLEADIQANTQQYISRIEKQIRKCPGDWLWMHRRWREQPREVEIEKREL